MFTSRTFVIFLVPVAFLALAAWFIASAEMDRNNVRVAGALVGAPGIELTVDSSYLTREGGARKLVVEMRARNVGADTVNFDPAHFLLVLADSENPAGREGVRTVFRPLRYASACEQAPNSVSSIPPGATRSMTVFFYGETLPRGEEWKDHFLSLEYYDTVSGLMLSKLLNPTGE